jgi:AcrR family transcriptional regulator
VIESRREQKKRATRQALQAAADRLFARQGYTATTVRDIAEAAGVTERTFFRYFVGKEDLIVDDALSWLPLLEQRLRDRPESEDIVTALRRSVNEMAERLRESERPTPLWLFSDGPPAGRVRRRSPGAVLRVEASLAAAIRERLERTGQPSPIDREYLAQLLGKTVLGLLRGALIRSWQLGAGDQPAAFDAAGTRPPGSLIDQAFSILQVPPAVPTDPEPARDPATNPEPARDPATNPEPARDPATNPEPARDPATNPEPARDPTTEPEPAARPS